MYGFYLFFLDFHTACTGSKVADLPDQRSPTKYSHD